MSFEKYFEEINKDIVESRKLSEKLKAKYLRLFLDKGFIPIGQTPNNEPDKTQFFLKKHTNATLAQVASKLKKIQEDNDRRNEVLYTEQPYCERKDLPCCKDNDAGNESNGLLSPPSLLRRKN